MNIIDFQFGEYHITSNKAILQPTVIHNWLTTKSHWAIGIPFETVRTAIENSFCIGALYQGAQIGFARLITDYSIFAYLADVYVEEEHRGMGISMAMMEGLMNEDWVKNLRRLMLATKDAHTLYMKYGFDQLTYPSRMMEILRHDIYNANISSGTNDISSQ